MIATLNTLYKILEIFLNYEWNINTPIHFYLPSALVYIRLILLLNYKLILFNRYSFHDSDLTWWFLVYGANPNQQSDINTDCIPLSIAFKEASFEIIQALLNNSASL